MRIRRESLRLYGVTDRSWLNGERLYDQVEKALKGGVTMIQLREKNMDRESFIEEAKEIGALCRRYGALFLINDQVEIARLVDADGVHVGQGDMNPREARAILGEDKIIGVTARTLEQGLKAQEDGADYLGVGAVFPTSTKKDTSPVSRELLKEICSSVSIPVVAIGGINQENILQLAGCGLSGAAVVSSIFAQADIERAASNLRCLADKIVQEEGAMKTALTIAGSDSSGGAGIQADLKTMTALGVYGMSAITALTAQNTIGVAGIQETTPEFLGLQLDCIFTDIFPDAVKIGMVSSSGLIQVIGEKLREYKAENIVVDPVMVATSGARLMEDSAVQVMKETLFPIASVLTPNIPEAQVLAGVEINSPADMAKAARLIGEAYGCAVLCKGGHQQNDANDVLYHDGKIQWFYGKRVENPNTHGTGCTLSSAIASNLAKGLKLEDAVAGAKEYLSGALAYGLDLGKGQGPMNHAYRIP